MYEDLTLQMDDGADFTLTDDGTGEVTLDNDTPYYRPGTSDYEELQNLPQINGVTLIGNKLLSDLFPDGIIIDGGDSTGVM